VPNQDSVLLHKRPGLLACDVWEHAYYLNYQNRRADYLKAWWNISDYSVLQVCTFELVQFCKVHKMHQNAVHRGIRYVQLFKFAIVQVWTIAGDRAVIKVSLRARDKTIPLLGVDCPALALYCGFETINLEAHMTIQLRPDQEQLIGRAIQAGLVRGADDVLDVGVEAIRQRLEKRQALNGVMNAEQWSKSFVNGCIAIRQRRRCFRMKLSAGIPFTGDAASKWRFLPTPTSSCAFYNLIIRIPR